MRANRVVEGSVLLAEVVHLVGAGDGEVVEALALQSPDKRFGMAVHLWSGVGDSNDLDAITS